MTKATKVRPLRAGRRVSFDDDLALQMMAWLRATRPGLSVWAAALQVARRLPGPSERSTAARLANRYKAIGNQLEDAERRRDRERQRGAWVRASPLLGSYFDYARLDPEGARLAKALMELAGSAVALANMIQMNPGQGIHRAMPEPAQTEADRIIDTASWLLARHEARTAKRGN